MNKAIFELKKEEINQLIDSFKITLELLLLFKIIILSFNILNVYEYAIY